MQAVKVECKISCKIRGFRFKQTVTHAFQDTHRDDGTKIVQIKSFEYRVPKENISAWLELYGCVKSVLVEDCFKDAGDSEERNKTGNYFVKKKRHYVIR
jgi:hypothetical protein